MDKNYEFYELKYFSIIIFPHKIGDKTKIFSDRVSFNYRAMFFEQPEMINFGTKYVVKMKNVLKIIII